MQLVIFEVHTVKYWWMYHMRNTCVLLGFVMSVESRNSAACPHPLPSIVSAPWPTLQSHPCHLPWATYVSFSPGWGGCSNDWTRGQIGCHGGQHSIRITQSQGSGKTAEVTGTRQQAVRLLEFGGITPLYPNIINTLFPLNTLLNAELTKHFYRTSLKIKNLKKNVFNTFCATEC